MENEFRTEPTRADISNAWIEGVSARKCGGPRLSNPYIGRNATLAKEWDEGWNRGSFSD